MNIDPYDCSVVAGVFAFLLLIVASMKLNNQTWWRCSWCGWWFSDLGFKQRENPGIKPTQTSHGICPECAKVENQRWREMDKLK